MSAQAHRPSRNVYRLRGGLTALLAGVLMLLALPTAADGRLMRWVDEKGQVHYGDKIPPQSAKQGREELDRRGLVTKTVPKELDAAGLERQRLDQRDADMKAAQFSARRDHDRYLLQSFGSVADLQSAREERLSALDARISLAQKAAEENEKVLDELRGRAGKNPPTGELAKQIEMFETSLVDNLQLSKRLQAERAETEQKYSHDIERFKLLRSGKIRPGD